MYFEKLNSFYKLNSTYKTQKTRGSHLWFFSLPKLVLIILPVLLSPKNSFLELDLTCKIINRHGLSGTNSSISIHDMIGEAVRSAVSGICRKSKLCIRIPYEWSSRSWWSMWWSTVDDDCKSSIRSLDIGDIGSEIVGDTGCSNHIPCHITCHWHTIE